MLKIILILISVVVAKVPAEKVNRAEQKKKIMAGCLEMNSAVADKKAAVCKCIVDNFDKKSTEYDLKVLAVNYDPKKVENNDKDLPASALQSFDFEVATACLENPNWRIKE